MKYKQFDVVLLKNSNYATILGIENNKYNVEIVNDKGIRIDMKLITDDDIEKSLFIKQKLILMCVIL